MKIFPRRAIAAPYAAIVVSALALVAPAANREGSSQPAVPAWVFALNPPDSGKDPADDRVKRLHMPNSTAAFTQAELSDLFAAPDWHPQSHSAMPEIVAHGRAPDVYACGYCHTAGGQGRPENAALAGLPAPYISQQVADFKSGARRSAWRGPYRPVERMIHTATFATAQEIAAAAEFFSRQTLQLRVRVVESARVPRTRVVGWVYAAIRGAGQEPLGERLIEISPDPARHEKRDDEMLYVAYVPPGSIARGRVMASTGVNGLTLACVACHGAQLRGAGFIPAIAGRSPSYLLRQLLAFQIGARASAAGQPMQAVVARLKIADMIDAVAYAASLPP
jgi:cytochrome c553